jgi:hypothetical protein
MGFFMKGSTFEVLQALLAYLAIASYCTVGNNRHNIVVLLLWDFLCQIWSSTRGIG